LVFGSGLSKWVAPDVGRQLDLVTERIYLKKEATDKKKVEQKKLEILPETKKRFLLLFYN
jgi:hypothetical protein